jgi:hypothetical protein
LQPLPKNNKMKRSSLIALLLASTFFFVSCEVVGGIFKAGVFGGILLVVVVVGLVIWLISKMRGGGKGGPTQ